MAKFYGKIGFAETAETSPDVWEERYTERAYSGDVLQDTRRLQSEGKRNDDVAVSNRFSIVADPFARLNFHAMRYVVYMGTKWKITDVSVQYPRLVLSVGGVFNAETEG